MACAADWVPSRWREMAKSIIMMAFFFTMPMSRITPINAMMIDFAISRQRDGTQSAAQAIYRACHLRVRPILMTTVAAIFGAVPLALGTGDGAELRQPLGIAVVGGLILSQLLTLYTTPVVYVAMDRLRRLVMRGGARMFNRARPTSPSKLLSSSPPNTPNASDAANHAA